MAIFTVTLNTAIDVVISEKDYLEKNKKKAKSVLKENKVGVFLLLRYLAYLTYRKVFKVSCGFNI